MLVENLKDLGEMADKIFLETDSLQTLKFKLGFDLTNCVAFDDEIYKKILIHETKYVDIYIICWRKGQRSDIHGHPEKGCVMTCISGKLQENKYNNNPSSLIGMTLINPEDINYNYGNLVMHEIISLEDTVSLHVYHK